MMTKITTKTRSELEYYISCMPKHANIVHNETDAQLNWDYCKNYYGSEFSFQLINVDKSKQQIADLPIEFLKFLWLDYLHNKTDGIVPCVSRTVFKIQWLLDEYLSTGFKYPAQTVWNWRQLWWEIHPGVMRGLIYNMFEQTNYTAFYHPMVPDVTVDSLFTFESVDDVIDTMNYRNYHRVYAKIVQYYDRPLYAFHIRICDTDLAVEDNEKIFYKNIENGINIAANSQIIEQIQAEIDSWPSHPIKDALVFNGSTQLPTLYIDSYDCDKFYAGLYLFGTRLRSIDRAGFVYTNLNV